MCWASAEGGQRPSADLQHLPFLICDRFRQAERPNDSNGSYPDPSNAPMFHRHVCAARHARI